MVLRPAVDVFWVRPHEISKGALRWYLLKSIYLPNLVKRVDIRRESAMNAKYLIYIATSLLSTSAASGRKSKV